MIHYLKNKVGVIDFANAHFIFEVITFLSKIQNHSKNRQIMVVKNLKEKFTSMFLEILNSNILK